MIDEEKEIRIPAHILSGLEDIAADNLILADLIEHIAICPESTLSSFVSVSEQQH